MELVELWWRRIFQSSDSDNITVMETNKSIDVMCANCISPQEAIACIRSVIVAFAGIITACFALIRIVNLHATTSSHIRLVLFYILFVHCIASSFEWFLGWTTQMALFISYAKAIELLIICYLYLDVASKMMHWSSIAGKRLCFSALFLMFTYFTMFLVAGLVLSIEPWRDCHAPYWIWFSSGEFVMVQLMVGSFLLILQRMNRISAAPSIRSSQRRNLFSLFWTFETSALADLGYHIGLFFMADDVKGCSGVFDHDQLRYSLLKFPYDIVSFFMPVWAILFVFRTASKASSYDENSTESFYCVSPSLTSAADTVVVRNWQRCYRPFTQPSQHHRPVSSVRRPRRSRLHKVSSAFSTGRCLSTRSLVSSPLYSIPEETINHEQDAVAALDSDTVAVVGSLDRFSTVPLINE